MPEKKLNYSYPRAKEIIAPAGYINTDPPYGEAGKITIAENIGKKVILVDFWTTVVLTVSGRFLISMLGGENIKTRGC